MADQPEVDERDRGLNIGDLDPSQWDEAVAVTDRPQDTPEPNTTFAERAKARQRGAKQVDSAENKAVTGSETKRKRR